MGNSNGFVEFDDFFLALFHFTTCEFLGFFTLSVLLTRFPHFFFHVFFVTEEMLYHITAVSDQGS